MTTRSIDPAIEVILLADDDAFMRSLIAAVIRGARRYDVVVAGSGREALDLLVSTRPPVCMALLDFVMPQGNGLEVAQRIRTGLAGVPRDLPVIMLTGHKDSGLVRTAMELDVNAYVLKPVTRETLFARLERARATAFALKDPAAYRAVEVPAESVERPRAAPAVAASPPEPDPHAAAQPQGTLAPPRVTRVQTPVAHLLPGQILAREVRSSSGNEVIVPAYIQLDKALIARLSDLADIGMIPATVVTIDKGA